MDTDSDAHLKSDQRLKPSVAMSIGLLLGLFILVLFALSCLWYKGWRDVRRVLCCRPTRELSGNGLGTRMPDDLFLRPTTNQKHPEQEPTLGDVSLVFPPRVARPPQSPTGQYTRCGVLGHPPQPVQ
ncbi:hypothetical protein HGRIS_005612 [Hohenbuehelia grisea]|uniref:Uncharacterized protein n=1 Tax=Hohenbuehelia grisea TaxID=104357 RepID=A0ABR3JZ75_9AGAR